MALSDSRPTRRLCVVGGCQPQSRRVSPDDPHHPSNVPCPVPRRIETGACVDCFPAHTAFPVSQAGRHPHLHFRGLLRLHARYGPLDCSTAQGGLCHEAPAQSVARPNRSSLPEQSTTLRVEPSSTGDTRRRGARRVEDGRGGLGHAATLRFPSPLIKPDVRICRVAQPLLAFAPTDPIVRRYRNGLFRTDLRRMNHSCHA